ncbi:MAG: cupredoxin domain-containing protein [Candidatus Micrarchaeota archaeon]
MGNDISINKTTLMLSALLLALLAGAYVVFAGGGQPGPSTDGEPSGATQPPPSAGGVQEVYLKATGDGYDKSEIVVKKGQPVRLHFTAIDAGCGAQLVIYGTDVRAISKNGQETVVEFTPDKEGTFEFNCGMKMFPPGRFVVTA